MDIKTFAKVADSLRQYRRAELKDFTSEVGENPIDELYVDPLPSDAVLSTVLSGNTTFLTGRKGTGKSTIFAKAQSEIRKQSKLISVYIDVKSLHELTTECNPVGEDQKLSGIDPTIFRAHMLRKHFLGEVLRELVSELRTACEAMNIWDRWVGRKRGYQELINKLDEISDVIKAGGLRDQELPILQQISVKSKHHDGNEQQNTASAKLTAKATLGPTGPSFSASPEIGSVRLSKSLQDNELYYEYSDIVLRSFPFTQIISEITDLLDEAKLLRLIVFFDDFSELDWISQRLFVDVILAPLNNATNERIKLKIAGYPGRVYYGRIDPGKVDTICLDFSELYRSSELQTAEANAIDYTRRLLEQRFNRFGVSSTDFFAASNPDDIVPLLFQVSMNVPRLLGNILHQCFLDRVSRGQTITAGSIRLAASKYYVNVVAKYFDRTARFALEPFEQKLDRHNQKKLLRLLLDEAVDLKKRISRGEVGGSYFQSLGENPPVSHFMIDQKLEPVLASLELNFLLTKYSGTRDKDGRDVSVYAFLYGLAESEKFSWGYPPGREFRNYFTQRCFDFNRKIRDFLSTTSTIGCDECTACFPIDDVDKFEFFAWSCPTCHKGSCSVVQLSGEFEHEVAMLDESLMLEEVELEILTALFDSQGWMRAGEISVLIDQSYQLIGRRTSKLQDKGLVEKSPVDGRPKSRITMAAVNQYFRDADD